MSGATSAILSHYMKTISKPSSRKKTPVPVKAVRARIGRPPGDPRRRKHSWIQVRVTQEQHARYNAGASRLGLPLSQVITRYLDGLMPP